MSEALCCAKCQRWLEWDRGCLLHGALFLCSECIQAHGRSIVDDILRLAVRPTDPRAYRQPEQPPALGSLPRLNRDPGDAPRHGGRPPIFEFRDPE